MRTPLCFIALLFFLVGCAQGAEEADSLPAETSRTLKTLESDIGKAKEQYNRTVNKAIDKAVKSLERQLATQTKRGKFDAAMAKPIHKDITAPMRTYLQNNNLIP